MQLIPCGRVFEAMHSVRLAMGGGCKAVHACACTCKAVQTSWEPVLASCMYITPCEASQEHVHEPSNKKRLLMAIGGYEWFGCCAHAAAGMEERLVLVYELFIW